MTGSSWARPTGFRSTKNNMEHHLQQQPQTQPQTVPSWVQTQHKTFTSWANTKLDLARQTDQEMGVVTGHMTDLLSGLHTGVNLSVLVQYLTHHRFPFEKRPHSQFQFLSNTQMALDSLQKRCPGIHLVSIDAAAIVNGELKLILGLVWQLILLFEGSSRSNQRQVAASSASSSSSASTATTVESSSPNSRREELLQWINSVISQHQNGNSPVSNFTTDWTSGENFLRFTTALGTMLHKDSLSSLANDSHSSHGEPQVRVRQAFELLKSVLNIPMVMSPDDVVYAPDELSLMTYFLCAKAIVDDYQQQQLHQPQVTKMSPMTDGSSLQDDYSRQQQQQHQVPHQATTPTAPPSAPPVVSSSAPLPPHPTTTSQPQTQQQQHHMYPDQGGYTVEEEVTTTQVTTYYNDPQQQQPPPQQMYHQHQQMPPPQPSPQQTPYPYPSSDTGMPQAPMMGSSGGGGGYPYGVGGSYPPPQQPQQDTTLPYQSSSFGIGGSVGDQAPVPYGAPPVAQPYYVPAYPDQQQQQANQHHHHYSSTTMNTSSYYQQGFQPPMQGYGGAPPSMMPPQQQAPMPPQYYGMPPPVYGHTMTVHMVKGKKMKKSMKKSMKKMRKMAKHGYY